VALPREGPLAHNGAPRRLDLLCRGSPARRHDAHYEHHNRGQAQLMAEVTDAWMQAAATSPEHL
jgi:hypothetical protein